LSPALKIIENRFLDKMVEGLEKVCGPLMVIKALEVREVLEMTEENRDKVMQWVSKSIKGASQEESVEMLRLIGDASVFEEIVREAEKKLA
jgi:hypothetical protein